MNKKMIITFIIVLLVSMQLVFAGDGNGYNPISKEIVFEITKNYEACSFEITTEKTGNFNVYLFPGGSKSNANVGKIENGNSCTIKVQDVTAGEWRAIVEEDYTPPVVVSTETENATEENKPSPTPEVERTAETVIGKVQVSVKAIDKTAFSIGNVTVARDIVGLQEYFKDDSIVVEWTDTSCGNVNVTIIDTNSSQILDKQTVQGNYYEFEIPTLSSEITVDVVPSTSAGITGANTQYTVPVINNPDATIVYENREYTNRDTITVTATLNQSYSLLFMNGDAEVQETGIMSAGTYDFEIPINEGVNQLLTYVIDEKHNMRSTGYSIIRDSIKPALTLDMEYDGAATYDDVAYITGTIKDYDTFKINEVEPVVKGDGSFEAEYLLKDGINILEIKASDIAGNETIYEAEITKLVKTTPEWQKYVFPAAFAIFLIIALIIWKKRGGGSRREDDNDAGISKEEKKMKVHRVFNVKGIKLKNWHKNIIVCAITFVCAFIFFHTVILWGIVPSSSMEPTLNIGDAVIVNGLAYVKNEPVRGDIIVFKGTEGDMVGKTHIKRIIGLPGDDIMFIDGYVYINGQICYEEYLNENIETNSNIDFEVPEGCYFVMGDNREHSHDSRFWSDPYIRKTDIKGKMLASIPISKVLSTIRTIF